MGDIIEIDGSVLEGGGQILRLAMSLSSLLKKSIKINKIRANRSKGGLRPQHLKGIQMASEMCNGNLSGAVVESTEIAFQPGDVKSGKFEADTQTAGSVALILQVAIPIALYGPSNTTLRMKGGTNADMAPTIDHTVNVFLPILKKFGGECECSILRRGYYPRGGGEVEVKISPVDTLKPIHMTTFGCLTRIWGRSYVAGTLPIKMAHEMADAAQRILKKIETDKVKVNIDRVKESPQDAVGIGSGITLFAETDSGCILGASALGSRFISTVDVGVKAANELVSTVVGESCVDPHTQDQIVILMALADGKSIVKCGPMTQHTETAIFIAEKLTNAKFVLNEDQKHVKFLECDGIGLKNTNLKKDI